MAVGKLFRKDNALSENPKILFIEEFSLIHYFNEEVFAWIDKIVACGANGMRTSGMYVWDKGRGEGPFLQIKADYTYQFNEKFFTYMQSWVKYADERRVAIVYELFDRNVFADRAPTGHQYDPFYPLVKGDINEFTKPNDPKLNDIQKAYIRKVVETVKNLNVMNVILSVMNEFEGKPQWYSGMSKYIKNDLKWEHLLAGSISSLVDTNPNVDLWFGHIENYDDVSQVILPQLNSVKAKNKIFGFSNSGVRGGASSENPDKMREMVAIASINNLQIFSFRDHQAVVEPSSGKLQSLNEEVYRVIAEEFRPTGFSLKMTTIQDGVLSAYEVVRLPSTHPEAFRDKNGVKAIRANKTDKTGFLVFGPYATDYPIKPLKVYFSILSDDNSGSDNQNFLIIDVYDHRRDRILAQQMMSRGDFPKANEFCLFAFDFTPPGEDAEMEFRIFYYSGGPYVAADWIVVVDPEKIRIVPDHNALLKLIPPIEKPMLQKGVLYMYDVGRLPSDLPDSFRDKNGAKAIRSSETKGFLVFGPYATDYPIKLLKVYFSILIDDNSGTDDQKFPIIHVYDHRSDLRLCEEKKMSRSDFPKVNEFYLFDREFTPPSKDAELEFRIYYFPGGPYVAVDWIAVVDPEIIPTVEDHDALLKLITPIEKQTPSVIKPQTQIVPSLGIKEQINELFEKMRDTHKQLQIYYKIHGTLNTLDYLIGLPFLQQAPKEKDPIEAIAQQFLISKAQLFGVHSLADFGEQFRKQFFATILPSLMGTHCIFKPRTGTSENKNDYFAAHFNHKKQLVMVSGIYHESNPSRTLRAKADIPENPDVQFTGRCREQVAAEENNDLIIRGQIYRDFWQPDDPPKDTDDFEKVITRDLEMVLLRRLKPDSDKELRGQYASVIDELSPQEPCDSSEYLISKENVGGSNQPCWLDRMMAYYHIDLIQQYFRELGLEELDQKQELNPIHIILGDEKTKYNSGEKQIHLCQVRNILFKLTNQVVNQLRQELSLSGDIIKALTPLINQEIREQENFSNAIKNCIGPELTDKWKDSILKHALAEPKKFTDALEPRIVYHEFVHAVTDALAGLTCLEPGEVPASDPRYREILQAQAMNEGLANYFACSLAAHQGVKTPSFYTGMESAGKKIQWGELRSLASSKKCLKDVEKASLTNVNVQSDIIYPWGDTWGCYLWNLRSTIGSQITDLLVAHSIFFLTRWSTFGMGVLALVLADQLLFEGANKEKILAKGTEAKDWEVKVTPPSV